MAFVNAKYESTTLSGICLCRLSDGEFGVTGAEPAAAVDRSVKAYASGSRRRHGIHTRGIVVSKVFGTAPDTFKRYKFLTVLTTAAWAAYNVGDIVTIGTEAWNVVRKIGETAV